MRGDVSNGPVTDESSAGGSITARNNNFTVLPLLKQPAILTVDSCMMESCAGAFVILKQSELLRGVYMLNVLIREGIVSFN